MDKSKWFKSVEAGLLAIFWAYVIACIFSWAWRHRWPSGNEILGCFGAAITAAILGYNGKLNPRQYLIKKSFPLKPSSAVSELMMSGNDAVALDLYSKESGLTGQAAEGALDYFMGRLTKRFAIDDSTLPAPSDQIMELVAEGKWTEAIADYRGQTGMSLVQAKTKIQAAIAMRVGELQHASPIATNQTENIPRRPLSQFVTKYIADGKREEAVQFYQEQARVSREESEEAVDSYAGA